MDQATLFGNPEEERRAARKDFERRQPPQPPRPPTDLEAIAAQARRSDPFTSKDAAAIPTTRRGSMRFKLLAAYNAAGERGCTAEEATEAAGLKAGAWKRCSELRSHQLIQWDGERTRQSSEGAKSMVCTITDEGRAVLAAASNR